MSEQTSETFGAGLVYAESIPLSWKATASPRDSAETSRQQQANEDILRMILGLDEHRPELPDEESALIQELVRLDFKLNLLLDLVGQVLAGQIAIPEPVPVKLGASSVQWDCRDPPPAVGALLQVAVYLDLRYPRPVVLPGRVQGVQSIDGGHRLMVEFEELGKPVQDWLEKFIFRHHRRSVAQAKRGSVEPHD